MADDANVVELNAKTTKTTQPGQPSEKPKGKRGRKPGVQPKERAPLPANAFRVRMLTTEESRANVKRKRIERSDDQKKVDKLVFDNWKQWIESGMPMNWVDMPVIEWPVPKAHYEDAMFMMTKACTLYGRKPIYGDIHEEVYEGEVCIVIPFCIITRPPKRQQRIAESNDG